MLQKKKLSTPTTRFASVITVFDFYKIHNKSLLKNKVIYKKTKKCFFNSKNINVTPSSLVNFAGVVEHYSYNKKPYQALLLVKSLYNNLLIIPGIEYLVPGSKVFDLTKSINFHNVYYSGSQISLEDLPYGLFASFISNNLNNK